jgi:toxin-antitoxin system PIN domain toxin
MTGVDANVLIHAADEDSPFHRPCRALVEDLRARGAPWCATWSVIYQYLRVTTHARAPRRSHVRAAAAAWIREVLALPGFSVLTETPDHGAMLARTLEEIPGLQGNILHDVHIAVILREHGIRTIWTRDADFHRFPFLEVIDPLDPRAGGGGAGGEGMVRERSRRPVRRRGSRTPSSRR